MSNRTIDRFAHHLSTAAAPHGAADRAAYTVGGQSIHVTTEDKPVLRLMARHAGTLGCARKRTFQPAPRHQGRGNPTYATSPLIGATMALSGNTLAANAFSSTRR